MTGEARMDRDPEFQEILSLLPGTVLGRGMEQFTKSGYRPSLAAYTDENRRIFERMQRFCARCSTLLRRTSPLPGKSRASTNGPCGWTPAKWSS